MTVTPFGPTTAARRQVTLDRLTELFQQRGSAYPDERATEVLELIQSLGWSLPRALDDPPPPVREARPDHRQACMEQIRADLAARKKP